MRFSLWFCRVWCFLLLVAAYGGFRQGNYLKGFAFVALSGLWVWLYHSNRK